MSAVIIEHVKLADLPEKWREKLQTMRADRVTVRIEEETPLQPDHDDNPSSVDLLFGMWRDREDVANVEDYMSKLRASRYNPDGSRNQA